MTNEIIRKTNFEEEFLCFEKEIKDFFGDYKNKSDGEDPLEVCLVRSGYRIALKAKAEINRQKAEIENYSHNNKTMTKDIRDLQKALEQARSENEARQAHINLLKAEIERLTNENKMLTDYNPANRYANCVLVKNGEVYTKTLGDYDKLLADISSEARKEFAERLKEKAKKTMWISSGELVVKDYTISSEEFDNLLEEMESERE